MGINFARWNNSKGVAGLAPNCKVTPIKLFAENAPSTSNLYFRTADLIEAQKWLLGLVRLKKGPGAPQDIPDVRIVSSQLKYPIDTIVICYLDSLYQEGVLWVNSTGNNGDINFPAGQYQESTFTVGVSEISNSGYRILGVSGAGDGLDCVAPSAGVHTLDLMGTAGQNTYGSPYGDYVQGVSGSSFAAPQAAGIAALVYSRRPDLIPATGPPIVMKAILDHSSQDLIGPPEEDSIGWDRYYGNGRINAFRALLSVIRGDVNNDAVHDIVDVVSIINVAFRNGSTPGLHRGLYDMVCDGIVCDIADVVAIINVVLRNGTLPAPCFEYEY